MFFVCCFSKEYATTYTAPRLFLFLMLFMLMNSDINKLICILFVHLSSIILENFKDRALIIPKLLEFIELHTYKFGLVYFRSLQSNRIESIRKKNHFI